MRKGEIGRRIRAVRRERSLTLRQVAAAAGLSATHISEIERGHTTPTVGALLRVAHALAKEPHFFLETERLPEISLIRANEERRVHELRAPRGTSEALTHGIPGNRILATRTVLQPHSTDSDVFSFSGEEGGFLVSGARPRRRGRGRRDADVGHAWVGGAPSIRECEEILERAATAPDAGLMRTRPIGLDRSAPRKCRSRNQ